MGSLDAIVIGAGVIGTSVAYRSAMFEAKRVLCLIARRSALARRRSRPAFSEPTTRSSRTSSSLWRRGRSSTTSARARSRERHEGVDRRLGFSGHGLKLSPGVGRVLAQETLGLSTDVSLLPYSLERFRTGKLLSGQYGPGAVS
jgi:glycine/D-amino acid oxidase-like deaminating enzyme